MSLLFFLLLVLHFVSVDVELQEDNVVQDEEDYVQGKHD